MDEPSPDDTRRPTAYRYDTICCTGIRHGDMRARHLRR